MDALQLGPNGGLLYCMEYLEANLDWLRAKLDPLRGHYFLFDCPGQVELCTHHGALRSIFSQMAQWDLRLTAVHLVDSHYCTDPAKFISVLCTSLATMLHVELPHVNLLSKMDLIEHYGKLAFNLDYYTEVLDLSYLLDHLASDPFFRHYRQLNEKLVQLIEDYSLDKESIQRVLKAVDKANGYCFGVQEQRSLEAVMSAAVGADFHFSSYPCSLASATAKSGRPGAQEWPCLPLQMTDFLLTSGLPESQVVTLESSSIRAVVANLAIVRPQPQASDQFSILAYAISLDKPSSISTLGLQEKYLAPSEQSVEQEAMQL
ncbi:hypothetical protein E2I00_011996 [Balaenoptera physalus]|uniref:GPN-loop GTPase 2 n=1 Tax=Balaenoptera physalus TaxID=9770 RepID=A0A643C0U3_BALPH|nr:hypothetical protein E2I00_011996 [Balaenoptera physalus]